MTKTEYTPGPWHLGNPSRDGEDAYMCEVMTAYATKNAGADIACYDLICRTWSHERLAASVRLSRKECIANARLIAAAPELLVALKAVVAIADRKTDEFDAARAAIAKAEGET